jgi:hypothetical protein
MSGELNKRKQCKRYFPDFYMVIGGHRKLNFDIEIENEF